MRTAKIHGNKAEADLARRDPNPQILQEYRTVSGHVIVVSNWLGMSGSPEVQGREHDKIRRI
jgi:hypothetical protein